MGVQWDYLRVGSCGHELSQIGVDARKREVSSGTLTWPSMDYDTMTMTSGFASGTLRECCRRTEAIQLIVVGRRQH